MRSLPFLSHLLLLFPPLTLSNQIGDTKQYQDKYNVVQSRIANEQRCPVKVPYKDRPPIVLTADSSHLWVSWGWGWFDCDQNSIKTVIILSSEEDVTKQKEYAVTHSDGKFGNAIIEADPCFTHSLSVKMFNNSEATQNNVYNEKIDRNLYSGMLGQTVRGACLKDELTLSIPDPPDAVMSCIKTRGEQRLEKSGDTVISLEILNIDQKQDTSETVCIKVSLSGIKSCQEKENGVTIKNVTRVGLENCQNESGVNLAAAISIPLLLVAFLITGMVGCFLGRKRLQRIQIPVRDWFCSREKCESSLNRLARACCLSSSCQFKKKSEADDCNPTYGEYEYEDGTLRKNTMEMTDHNQNYDQTMEEAKNIYIFIH